MTYWFAALGFIAMAGIAVSLNPIRALALAKDVGAFFLEKARAVAKWARDPDRNWWKIGCLSFAGFFAVASLYADSQRRQVVNVTERFTAQVAQVKGEAAAASEAATNNFNALLQCKALLAVEVGIAQETDRMNAAAVALAQASMRKATDDAAAWRRRYNNKTPSCAAATAALEGPCASLSDY